MNCKWWHWIRLLACDRGIDQLYAREFTLFLASVELLKCCKPGNIWNKPHTSWEREREWYFSWYYYWGIKVIIALSWIYGSPIIYLSGFCTSTLTSPFVFRSFASELQVESWRASVGLSCHLVKTLLSMGVARLPGFDYYQCRLPTSDALPDLNELTFVSCICLGKLNWGMQMFEF